MCAVKLVRQDPRPPVRLPARHVVDEHLGRHLFGRFDSFIHMEQWNEEVLLLLLLRVVTEPNRTEPN